MTTLSPGAEIADLSTEEEPHIPSFGRPHAALTLDDLRAVGHIAWIRLAFDKGEGYSLIGSIIDIKERVQPSEAFSFICVTRADGDRNGFWIRGIVDLNGYTSFHRI